jgi:putative hydrolase of the HAD superfamily
MAIEAVISDFGGVLTTPLFEAFKAYGRSSGVSPDDLSRAIQRETEAAGGRHPLYELEKGRITEAEFIRRVESHLGDGARLDGLRETYFANLHPNEPMIEFMRELRGRGLRMAMLTNNIREWEPLWRAKIPDIDAIFELVVDSAFVGMRKPEREIYVLTLERLGGGLAAESCLFVDDVDVNCHAARELGMTAVHFTSSKQAIPEIEGALRR